MAAVQVNRTSNRKMNNTFWPLRYLSEGYWLGDQGWASIRLLSVLLVLGLFTLFCALAFEYPKTTLPATLLSLPIERWSRFPEPFLKLGVCLFSVSSLRYALAPISALIGALFVGAYYVQEMFELKTLGLAMEYILASAFGLGYPSLRVADGEKKVKDGEVNLLDYVGGPGQLMVQAGNVVLCEKLRNPSGVYGEGSRFLSRFERIRDIATLGEHQDRIEKLTTLSKEGLDVTVSDIHYRYRLFQERSSGGFSGRTFENPYPYSKQALLNMAYNRSVTAGGLTSWESGIKVIVEGCITDYINRCPLDILTAPDFKQGDPRGDIYRSLWSKGTRERLKERGAELLWCDIGHFSAPEPQVADQRLDTWQARWKGNAEIIRAYGEAQRLRYQEVGRSEAQAEMVINIMHGMEDLQLEGYSRPQMRKLILLRIDQLLHSLPPPGSDTQ